GKAIKAAGGEEQLAKQRAQTWSEKGTYYGEGAAQPYTGKYAIQWPDKFRMEIEGVFTLVLTGDQGWFSAAGNTQEMNKEQVAQHRELAHGGWGAGLLPLKDPGYQLSPLGESKGGHRAVVGVKVTHKGHSDVNLYFDKDTGLLRKSQYRAKDAMTGKDREMVV